jgi:hypothetical protein
MKKSPKEALYVFLVEANKIALANDYKRFSIDTGVKEVDFFVNSKIDTIYDKGKGIFFKDEFLGYEQIREKALLAKDDILNDSYTVAVIEFIEAAIKSYLPKSEKPKIVDIEPVTLLEMAKEQNKPQVIIEEGLSAKKKAEKDMENEGFEDLGALASSLDDEEEIDEDFVEEEVEEGFDFDAGADSL